MNIQAIKDIVNAKDISHELKERLIINVLSEDPKVIPDLLKILHTERQRNKELIQELNVEVSRYHASIWNIKFLKKQRDFYNEETKKLYERWKGWVAPCFNNNFDHTDNGKSNSI